MRHMAGVDKTKRLYRPIGEDDLAPLKIEEVEGGEGRNDDDDDDDDDGGSGGAAGGKKRRRDHHGDGNHNNGYRK